MKFFKNSTFYILIIGGFSLLMYWIVLEGSVLETGRALVDKTPGSSQWDQFVKSLSANLQHPLAILLAQIVTIIFAARLFGWICRKIGQPSVVGEIIGGSLL